MEGNCRGGGGGDGGGKGEGWEAIRPSVTGGYSHTLYLPDHWDVTGT